jgi:hypothetical protein
MSTGLGDFPLLPAAVDVCQVPVESISASELSEASADASKIPAGLEDAPPKPAGVEVAHLVQADQPDASPTPEAAEEASEVPAVPPNAPSNERRVPWKRIMARNRNACDLKNQLHPILQDLLQDDLPEKKYLQVFRPALLLLSRILDSDIMLPFWYTIFLTPAEGIAEPLPSDIYGSRGKHFILPSPEQLTLTEDQKAQTMKALMGLGKNLS